MINSVSTITNTYGTNVYTKPLVTKANISPAFEGKRKTQNSENLYNFSSFLHGTAMLSDKIKIKKDIERIERKLYSRKYPVCRESELKTKKVGNDTNAKYVGCIDGKPYTGLVIAQRNVGTEVTEMLNGINHVTVIESKNKQVKASINYKKAEVNASRVINKNGRKEYIFLHSKKNRGNKYNIRIMHYTPHSMVYENHYLDESKDTEYINKLDKKIQEDFGGVIDLHIDILAVC